MNSLWIWFLYRVDGWTLRQIREAVVRQKLRWFRQELARQIGHRNEGGEQKWLAWAYLPTDHYH